MNMGRVARAAQRRRRGASTRRGIPRRSCSVAWPRTQVARERRRCSTSKRRRDPSRAKPSAVAWRSSRSELYLAKRLLTGAASVVGGRRRSRRSSRVHRSSPRHVPPRQARKRRPGRARDRCGALLLATAPPLAGCGGGGSASARPTSVRVGISWTPRARGVTSSLASPSRRASVSWRSFTLTWGSRWTAPWC
jgi:hypothetical protein